MYHLWGLANFLFPSSLFSNILPRGCLNSEFSYCTLSHLNKIQVSEWFKIIFRRIRGFLFMWCISFHLISFGFPTIQHFLWIWCFSYTADTWSTWISDSTAYNKRENDMKYGKNGVAHAWERLQHCNGVIAFFSYFNHTQDEVTFP